MLPFLVGHLLFLLFESNLRTGQQVQVFHVSVAHCFSFMLNFDHVVVSFCQLLFKAADLLLLLLLPMLKSAAANTVAAATTNAATVAATAADAAHPAPNSTAANTAAAVAAAVGAHSSNTQDPPVKV